MAATMMSLVGTMVVVMGMIIERGGKKEYSGFLESIPIKRALLKHLQCYSLAPAMHLVMTSLILKVVKSPSVS